MRSEPQRPSTHPSGQPPLGTAARIALTIPLLGMIGIFVAIGWEEGPWVPLGITGCVALVMAVSLWRSRGDRKLLQTDPAAGRRALNVRAARAGTLMARLIAVWVFCTILFVVVLLAFRS